MRLHGAGEFAARGLDLGHIDADAGAAVARGEIEYIEDPSGPRDDDGQPGGIGFARRTGRRQLGARGGIEQLQAARDRFAAVAGVDGMRISRVDPALPARGVARPDRRGQCFDQGPDRVDVAQQFAMAGSELGQLALDAPDLLEAEHGSSADGAPFGLDVAPGKRRRRDGKALAARAKRLDRALHDARLVGVEPGRERQDAARDRNRIDDAGIAENLRLLEARVPGDHDLRLGEQQRMRAVDLFAKPDDFGAVGGGGTLRAAAGADETDGGDDREGDHADDQRERSELMTMQLGEAGHIPIEVGKEPWLGSGGTRWRPGGGDGQGFRKKACAPISTKASGFGPDRVRHPHCPYSACDRAAERGRHLGPAVPQARSAALRPRIAAMYLRCRQTLRAQTVNGGNIAMAIRRRHFGARCGAKDPRRSQAFKQRGRQIAPDEMPPGIPSSRASARVVSRASSLVIVITSSMTERSRISGMNPAPIPWILCGPGAPPVSTALSLRSTASTRIDGLRALSTCPTPVAGPPVPIPETITSTAPWVSFQISSAVVRRWISGLEGFLNCCGITELGIWPSSSW